MGMTNDSWWWPRAWVRPSEKNARIGLRIKRRTQPSKGEILRDLEARRRRIDAMIETLRNSSNG